jgi:trehalose-6-phosphate synthase
LDNPRQELTLSSDRRSVDSKISLSGREVFVGAFPIGIEPSEFHSRLQKEGVQDMIRSMRDKFQGATVIVGVDRLDYIKGIPQKLYAFDMFLERHPEWIGKAILVQVAIPSRANLEMNQKLRVDVQKLIGEINGKYGMPHRFPSLFHSILQMSAALAKLTSNLPL